MRDWGMRYTIHFVIISPFRAPIKTAALSYYYVQLAKDINALVCIIIDAFAVSLIFQRQLGTVFIYFFLLHESHFGVHIGTDFQRGIHFSTGHNYIKKDNCNKSARERLYPKTVPEKIILPESRVVLGRVVSGSDVNIWFQHSRKSKIGKSK